MRRQNLVTDQSIERLPIDPFRGDLWLKPENGGFGLGCSLAQQLY